ncbi:thiol-disulfide oxidoreductase [Lacunisphaera limnophila]|uniref:Thiol-disulfide oxidoreductase n=1 Tax=Lacunisphaera limnophila TaxID=1838286 RepID=A0A1D8AX40_9BACT|nr:redoxin domain-containing protein [Lacunisphaera limnophila]AOS45440.1 thiol-disulfide oxidoreductase [Lacunisphaera limnophila]
MKSFTSLLFAGATAVVLGLAAQAAPAVGQPAPDFTLTDVNGQTHALSAYRGKTVVLEWVNPECPIVQKHYDRSGNLPATQSAVVAEGAVWFAINSGHEGAQGDFEAEEVVAWSRKNNAAFTAYLRDRTGEVGKRYDARHTPTLFIIDPAGTLVYAGAIDSISSGNPADIKRATNYVQAAFADLKAGKPVATPVTRAYGCGVKYAN